MRFYNRQHRHYCGIDLHVKTMYVCILDAAGQVLVHRNVKSTPAAFLEIVAPYRDDLVVAAECMFTWYWLADLCAAEGIAFVLGHALAMKAIHGGKAKNDKLDSHTIAVLLEAACCPSRTSTRRRCAPRAICCGAGSTWCANGASSLRTSKTRAPNTICRSLRGASRIQRIATGSARSSPIRVCGRASTSTWR
jgi:hypothetical protein